MRSCGRCNPPPRGTGRTLLRLLRRSRASQWADGCLLVIRLRRPDVTIPTVQVAPPGYSLGGSTNRGSAAALNSTFGSTGAPQHGTPALYDDTMSDGGATERALAAMDTATGVYQDVDRSGESTCVYWSRSGGHFQHTYAYCIFDALYTVFQAST